MTAKEFWNTFPHCCGYAGGCDGDLEGLPHEESCPLSRGHEPDLFEFAEAYAKSELARVTGERDAAEKALAERTAEVIEAAAQACENERVSGESGTEGDEAYNYAIQHAAAAVRALASRYAATPATSEEGPSAPDQTDSDK